MVADDLSVRIFLALQQAIDSSHRFEAAVAHHAEMHRTDIAALTQLMRAHSFDEPMSPSDLAHQLRLSPPATTALLDRLEGTGHLVRERHPDDRRRIVLRLTSRGERRLGRPLDVLFASIDAAMDNHSGDAKTATATVLEDVAAAVSAAADKIEDADTER